MSIENFRETLKDYAKDIKLNLGTVLTAEGSPGLNLNQILGIALASAYHTKSKPIVAAVLAEAAGKISDAEVEAAKAAATIMAMNNVYYRTMHLSDNPELGKLPARLRMNVIGKPGIEKVDFELYSLAVSAIAGCGRCVNSHVAEVQKAGVTLEGIQSSVRIASVINATAQAHFID